FPKAPSATSTFAVFAKSTAPTSTSTGSPASWWSTPWCPANRCAPRSCGASPATRGKKRRGPRRSTWCRRYEPREAVDGRGSMKDQGRLYAALAALLAAGGMIHVARAERAPIDVVPLLGKDARRGHHPFADASGRLPLLLGLPSGADARSLGFLPLAPG